MNAKKLLLTTAALVFFCCFSFSLKAQENSAPVEKKKQYVYEFNVTGLNSEQDASKMDSTLSGHGGIVSWETDYHHKKVKVTTSIYIQYKDLMTVCRHNKLEASEQHTLTEVEQQQ
ncbi:MAG TPA: hypothetical protein VI112_17495 [Bacteroidia bacterium]